MEAKAHLRFARMSPRKMRGVANLIRGRRIDEAMAVLQYVDKKAARLIRKLLISAVANAEHKGISDVDSLVVQNCSVDTGPIIKRWMSRAMGRANRIQRRTSHVAVVIAG